MRSTWTRCRYCCRHTWPNGRFNFNWQVSPTHQVRFFVLDEADGLLLQGYGDLINRLHQQIPKVTNDGNRLQMIVCSATLHSFDVKKKWLSVSCTSQHGLIWKVRILCLKLYIMLSVKLIHIKTLSGRR